MKRSIAYLGIISSVILGGCLGFIASLLTFEASDINASFIHVLIVTALGAFIGGVLAVIHVRRYMRIEKQFAKYLTFVPKNAGDLIKAIIGEMRYRKKIQNDVMVELTAHFEDELKDCKTDEEKEQKAQQLIADFGDVKLLGILLRRAKKRCRPLWRTVVARTFQAAGVLILCFTLYVVWFLTGKPIITTNYVAELNRIVRPVADDSLNAAPLYHKAAELVEKLPDDMKELLRKKYEETTAEQKQLINKWLIDNKQIIDLVIAGTQKPYYWQKYANKQNTGEMISILMPHLSDFRRLARALRLRAHLWAEQGRYEDAFDDIKACYRFGQHIRGDKSLVEQLVGMAIEALAAQTLRDILSEHQLDSVMLAALQNDFEQMIAGEVFVISVKAERMCMYDEIQRCFTEDRFGGGHLYLHRLRPLSGLTGFEGFDEITSFGEVVIQIGHILFTHPNKHRTREIADDLYAFWEKVVHQTPAQLRAEEINTEEESMKIIEGNILLEILTPALGRVCEIAHRNKIDVEATLIVIAILRYEQNIGGYPENLDKLIETGLLKALPIDPYSDQHLVYKRTDSDFVLYGVGENFEDDGGTVAVVDGRPRKWGTKDEGDWVFWPVPKSNEKK